MRTHQSSRLGLTLASAVCTLALLAAALLVLLGFPTQTAAAAQTLALTLAATVDERTPMPPPAARTWRLTLLREAHSQWGLDAPVAMLAAQVHAESAWQPQAVSHVGAQGLAQFMPATATWWCAGNQVSAAQCQPTNPTWALRALVGYDKWLFDRLPAAGAEPQRLPDRLWATLRSYNGGLGHWQAEARLARSKARADVDAACGRARRAAVHCAENLAYPHRVLVQLQPRYQTWGRVVAVTPVPAVAGPGS
jgi:soluble lytic murein transglycosylase-like protein